ncbi:MAG: hypothetical protein LBE76_05535, partial [Nitrososphaerota archaeon]|nr:hypothetical protein [Nitrososphaerota archaeon]
FKEETVRQLREEAYAYGKKTLKAKDIHTRLWRLDLTDKRAKRLLDVSFRGEKAGGVEHICAIMAQRKIYWQNGWIVKIDTGETDESLADLYVTPTLPASRVEEAKGYIDHSCWDYPRSFAVEVECYPQRHWDRLADNYRRSRKMGFPTVFIVPSQTDEEKLQGKLLEWNATLVVNAAKFEPNHPEQATIEITNMFNNQPNQIPELTPSHEPKQIEHPPQKTTTRLEQNIPNETKPKQTIAEYQQIEALMLELASQGRYFRLKDMKGKIYLCARQGQKERVISLYTEETKQLIEKNKIIVKGYNEK